MERCDNCGHHIPDGKRLYFNHLIAHYLKPTDIIPIFCSNHCMNWYMTSKLGVPQKEIDRYAMYNDGLSKEWKEFKSRM